MRGQFFKSIELIVQYKDDTNERARINTEYNVLLS